MSYYLQDQQDPMMVALSIFLIGIAFVAAPSATMPPYLPGRLLGGARS